MRNSNKLNNLIVRLINYLIKYYLYRHRWKDCLILFSWRINNLYSKKTNTNNYYRNLTNKKLIYKLKYLHYNHK